MSSERVAIFLQKLEGGGAERCMINLMQGLVAMGVAVDLVVVNLTGPFVPYIPREVRVVKLGTNRVSRSVWELAKYLRREKPAAMLSALTHVNVAAILARMVSRTAVRLVITEHSYTSLARRYCRRFSLLRASYSAIPWLYRKADGIVAVSHGAADDLAKVARVDRSRITTIFNPVVTPQLAELAREPVDHPWLAGGSTPVLMSVGRFVELKDFPTLVRAFARVRRQREAKLIMVGEGPKRAELTALIHELGLEADVAMPGYVSNPYPWMARAAALVCSSRIEGFGNTLVEAMECGTPVISTDCPSGPREILDGGRYGPLVAVGDDEGLAKAILSTLDAPLAREELRRRADCFSMARISRSYFNLLMGRETSP